MPRGVYKRSRKSPKRATKKSRRASHERRDVHDTPARDEYTPVVVRGLDPAYARASAQVHARLAPSKRKATKVVQQLTAEEAVLMSTIDKQLETVQDIAYSASHECVGVLAKTSLEQAHATIARVREQLRKLFGFGT